MLGRPLGIDHGLERLVLDADRGGRASRLLRLLGRDDRHRLAEVADAVAGEHRLVGELEPVRLPAGDVVVREHGVHARQRERLGDVDLEDPRVRVRAADRAAPEHPGRVEVARVGELAGDLRDRVGATGRRRADRGGSCRVAVLIAGSLVNRVEDLLVPGAAAEVPGERLADLVVARIGHAAEEVGRGDDEPRRAEAALHRARLGERALHRMELAVARETLDRDDVVAVRLGGEHETRADELAVEEHGARAALALLAGVLRAGELEAVAQRREQALARPGVGLAPLAVDGERRPSCEAPLERARREDAERMATVGGRAANVVDRARRLGDRLGKLRDVVERAGDEPDDGSSRAERRAQLAALAVDRDGERADRDDHRVPRPDLHEGLPSAARTDVGGDDQLVVGAARSASTPTRNSTSAMRREPRTLATSISAPSTRSGGSASPAGDAVPRLPPIVPRLRICGEPTVRDASASAGSSSRELAESPPCRSARRRVAASRSRATSREARPPRSGSRSVVGSLAVEVERDHDVRAALDRQRRIRALRLQLERLVERARSEDVHGDVLALLAHVRHDRAPPARRAACARSAVDTSTRTTIVIT